MKEKPLKIEWYSSNDIVPFDVVASAIGRENAHKLAVSVNAMMAARNNTENKGE